MYKLNSMKTLNVFAAIGTLSLVLMLTACQKDEDVGGKAHLHGHLEYNEQHVEGGHVHIWYGETSVADPDVGYDAEVVTNSEGEWEFENLYKGDYYLWGEFKDSFGESHEGGVAVKIEKKSEEVEVHIELE